jgi:hypothetical protein
MIWMSHKHKLRRRRNWRHFDHKWLQSVGVYRLDNRGQVLLGATMTNGTVALLVATPNS